MMNFKKTVGKLVALSLFPLAMVACGGEPAVSYSQDVKPIIDKNCIECHQAGGEGEVASGFDMASYDGLIKGARFGPMIIAGDAEGCIDGRPCRSFHQHAARATKIYFQG